MKNKLLLAVLVTILGSCNIFSYGRGGAESNPGLNQRPDRHHHHRDQNKGKGRGPGRNFQRNKMGADSRTWAPSDLENRLRRSSGLFLTTANALSRLRREKPDIFKEYFGDVASDKVAQEQDENIVLE